MLDQCRALTEIVHEDLTPRQGQIGSTARILGLNESTMPGYKNHYLLSSGDLSSSKVWTERQSDYRLEGISASLALLLAAPYCSSRATFKMPQLSMLVVTHFLLSRKIMLRRDTGSFHGAQATAVRNWVQCK